VDIGQGLALQGKQSCGQALGKGQAVSHVQPRQESQLHEAFVTDTKKVMAVVNYDKGQSS
jgi:hypothetical protein